MSETAQLIKLMHEQMAAMEKRHQEQEKRHQEQMAVLLAAVQGSATASATPASPPTTGSSLPSFAPFDATAELWTDYWARFQTFLGANSVAEARRAQVFLTNQAPVVYKLLANLASQQKPPKDINNLSLQEICDFMSEQFHPKRFVVRERFKFWSNMERKPGESIQELVARIRQDAVTCDFPSIKDPLDEAMRTRFICSVGNEAVLKALFKLKDDELNFARAIEVAIETEDAAKVAKETVYGSKPKPVHKIHVPEKKDKRPSKKTSTSSKSKRDFPEGTCGRCGKTGHQGNDCRFKNTVCNFCKKTGHLEAVCLQKKKPSSTVSTIVTLPRNTVNRVGTFPQFQQQLQLQGRFFNFEVDTGAGDNFISEDRWMKLGKPQLHPTPCNFISASGHPLPALGKCDVPTRMPADEQDAQEQVMELPFVVTSLPMNLLGRHAIYTLGLSLDRHVQSGACLAGKLSAVQHIAPATRDTSLQKACRQLCAEYPDLFKPGLGLLKDFELEVKFKPDVKPIFCKPRPVPFALQDDLQQAYEEGVKKGVWKPTQFNAYGTPVVPIRKSQLPGQTKSKLRVCGDYSCTVNPQLETHRYPMPLPEDLMRRLGGGYGFTKIDLADAYNQIALGPESQKKLALSTHRGVLLQMRLPFGISSAPGYFQEIMDQLTGDLPGVAVYLDDILVSGSSAEDHLNNLRRLLQRLQEKGLRCRLEKCAFAESSVEYLGHTLSTHGIAKGPKVDAIRRMPAPKDVSSLRSFLGSVQFYAKFLPNLSTVTEPLHRLTRKNTPWSWGKAQEDAFSQLKTLMCTDTVLAHFDPSLPIGISCDASEVGVGAVLFHRYSDGSERPIANVSKTLTTTQRKYSQIQKEALAIIFALQKFHQFLYGRHFILVTDHKPLLALFGPNKGTPALAANRLARWALMLSQYDYSIEYRKTADHGNADALSRLPAGPDAKFDGEEHGADIDTVCTIKTISLQLNPIDPGALARESKKDPVISTIIRYTKEGWPPQDSREQSDTKKHSVQDFKKIAASLSHANGCLFYGARVVIPESLQPQILQILHLGHFGMQRMKQLARSAVYWPRIDADIVNLCHQCTTCGEHQNSPAKALVHPWMLPEKPWSRVHLDHAINFLGSNWLVVIDAYSKYPCIHQTTSTSTRATIDLLEQDFAHFGYPHTLVTDNATAFTSEEFQEWCRARGIAHLTGAPYHPATNGAAERLVQTFKNALKKSPLPPKAALQEFLMQYRRTPLSSGYSPSELLNGRQIRSKIDAILPSPSHQAQSQQNRETLRTNQGRQQASEAVAKVTFKYKVGAPCYAMYYGPRRDKEPKWVAATVTKVHGPRRVTVKVLPRGPTWTRHIDQLRPRYGPEEDAEPGEEPSLGAASEGQVDPASPEQRAEQSQKKRNPRLPTGNEFGPDNPRRSERLRKTKTLSCC